jgi:hypothetical protein
MCWSCWGVEDNGVRFHNKSHVYIIYIIDKCGIKTEIFFFLINNFVTSTWPKNISYLFAKLYRYT